MQVTVFELVTTVYIFLTNLEDGVVSKLRASLPSTSHLLYNPIPTIAYPDSPLDLPSLPAPGTSDSQYATNSNGASPTPPPYQTILYIGDESLSLTNLIMTNSSCQVFSYDPITQSTRLESGKVNRLLMRRYATVQKARDADVFGILVGTLGVGTFNESEKSRSVSEPLTIDQCSILSPSNIASPEFTRTTPQEKLYD